MIKNCLRCDRESLIYAKSLCASCYISLKDHKKRIENKITEKQREKTNKWIKKYRKNNKEYREKVRISVKKNYQKNKEKWRIRALTNKYKKELIKIFGNKCYKCGSKKYIELHHSNYPILNNLPKKKQIEELIKIIVPLCEKCHRKLHRLENNEIIRNFNFTYC